MLRPQNIKQGPSDLKKFASTSEKLDIVIVGHADAGKGKFLANLLGSKKIDPTTPLVKLVTVESFRYQLQFNIAIGTEKSYCLFDHDSRVASGFIFLYDVSLMHTYAAFEQWREIISIGNEDYVKPVLLIGYAPNERAKERRVVSSHESKVLADSYGFHQKDVDYDSDMTQVLHRLVSDIRRDAFEAMDNENSASTTPTMDMIILGDSFVGKSSLIHRFLNREFLSNYIVSQPSRPKKVKVSVDEVATLLKLRDTPGHMNLEILTAEYLNSIHSALIVYDVANFSSFLFAQKVHQQVLQCKQEKRISFILIGNKTDSQSLISRQVAIEEGQMLAKSWRCPFFEVSLKTEDFIERIFKEAIRETRFAFNYDNIITPKLEWNGAVQVHNGSKFSKKYLQAKGGHVTWGSKQDATKNSKSIHINSSVGILEGNSDKGSLLILSVLGQTPTSSGEPVSNASSQIQILLPTQADRALLADTLFAELALHHIIEDLFVEVKKSTISQWKDPYAPQPSIIIPPSSPSSGSTENANNSKENSLSTATSTAASSTGNSTPSAGSNNTSNFNSNSPTSASISKTSKKSRN